MTSWIHTPRIKKTEEGPKVRDYFLTVEGGDFASYYVSLFNAHVFSNVNGRALHIYDKSNPISVSYSILKEAFEPVPNVSYVSEMMTGVTVLAGRSDPRYATVLPRLSKESLRLAATTVLTWSPALLEKVQATLADRRLPDEFDVGVHIRQRNRFDTLRAPGAAAYVGAVEDYARRLKRNNLSVFVLSTDPADFAEFQRLAPTSWTLFQVQPNVSTIRGSNLTSFNRQNSAIKLNAYVEHVSELYCMQRAAHVISTLSTDVGRFLYLTATEPVAFRSLDVQTYS